MSRFLFVASPLGIVSIRLEENGALGEICDIFTPLGELGPLRPAQRRACSHQICFDKEYKYLVEPNKGLDQLNSYKVDYESGCMTQIASEKMPISCCPRHVSFHPNKKLAYLLTEWGGGVITCRYEYGKFTPIQNIKSTPETFVGVKNLGAEIGHHLLHGFQLPYKLRFFQLTVPRPKGSASVFAARILEQFR